MGILIILPFLGLCSWVWWTTLIRLKMDIFDRETRRSFWTLSLVGVAVGIWAGLFLHYHPAPTHELVGFPFPVEIIRWQDGKRTAASLPLLVRGACFLTDLAFAALVASLPVTISSYLKDWKRNTPPT
jgi:hypothetical protein